MLKSFSNKICEKVELLPNISSTNATGGVQKESPRGGAGWGRGRETYQQKDTQGGSARPTSESPSVCGTKSHSIFSVVPYVNPTKCCLRETH